jgi:chromate transporter
MRRVYLSRLRLALPLFIRASSLHIGAAAAAVSLRGELVPRGLVSDDEFSQCFAIARLTPGTNLLALYAALGYRIASWSGAAAAIAVGTAVPATITAVVAVLYSMNNGNPLVSRFMSGAKAGALAVLMWGVVRLAWPVIRRHRLRAAAVATGALALALSGALSPFFIVLVAGVIGAFVLRTVQ